MNKILGKIINSLPENLSTNLYSWASNIAGIQEYHQDYRRFLKYSGKSDKASNSTLKGTNLEAQLTKDYHRIEKGLALKAPKQPFGLEVNQRLEKLVGRLDEGYEKCASDRAALEYNVASAQQALAAWNAEGKRSEEVAPLGPELLALENPDIFFGSRHSIRDFDPALRVTQEEIEKAVSLAMSTPSVCNRQAGRVHYLSDSESVRKSLLLQRGNTGFTDCITDLLVITVESGLFTGRGERNQKWIDGALFAMTLVWALHSIGLGSCMLNWSKTNSLSDQLRQEVGIPASEDIVVMIAVGNPAKNYRVARSPKRSLSQVLRIH